MIQVFDSDILKTFKTTSSILTSESSEIHSTSFILEQFESVHLFQKFDLKKFKILFAKIELPFLFKCNFFWPKCSSFKLPLSMKSILFWLQQIFKYEFTCETFHSKFLRTFRIIMLKNTILVFSETFFTCLTIFFTWCSMVVPLAKSFVPDEQSDSLIYFLLIDLCKDVI